MDEWQVSYEIMLKGFSLWGTVLGLYEGLFISELLVSGGLIGDVGHWQKVSFLILSIKILWVWKLKKKFTFIKAWVNGMVNIKKRTTEKLSTQ